MKPLFWIGVLVSTVAWFLDDWLAGLLVPDDGTRFVLAFAFAVVGGGLVMLAARLRALKSGRYEKAAWGVRRK